ncbi:MAG TPA: ABC transporter permease [Puia sp.]|nr:ABC transporter permease [Puia sp.]
MWKNYYKVIWRSLLKDRLFTILNVIGLSIGLTCVLLIFLWVENEWGVDRFHVNGTRLYQVMLHSKLPDGIHTQENTPVALGRALANEIPDVEYAASVQQGHINSTISSGQKYIRARRDFVDKDFFRMFSFPLIEGNKDQVLSEKYSVVLSDKLAMKLFNTTRGIIGRTVRWADDQQLFTVTGVFEAPPAISSQQFDLLFSYDFFYQRDTSNENMWENFGPSTYILVKKGADIAHLDNKLTEFLHTKNKDDRLKLSLRKYSDRYLYGQYDNGKLSGGYIRYIRLFSAFAVFILLLACINFINLSTSKAAGRMKEAGIRRVLGAGRRSLVLQYVGESILTTFSSLLIAILFTSILLHPFNAITGKQLSLHNNVFSGLILIGIGLITGLAAGAYPALYLSGFKTTIALTGKISYSWREFWLRKGLVVFQYSLCVLFIVGALVTNEQMKLVQTIDLGYKKDNIISFQNEKNLMEHFHSFIADAENVPGILAVSSINGDLYGGFSNNTETADWEGNTGGSKVIFNSLDIDYGAIELLGMQMEEGRSFSKNYRFDSLSVIVNQAAVKAMDIQGPIGKLFYAWNRTYHIIGVVRDFNFESLYKKVSPCFLVYNPTGGKNVLIKIKGGQEKDAIARIEKTYKKYNLGLPFGFTFMDQDYAVMYRSEEQVSILLRWFTALAITISCLGLFGLATFSVYKKQKEMSIRKVLGASATDIFMLFSQDFLKLILLAVFVSFPLSWWIMNGWLNDFAYRVTIGLNIFLFALLSISLITLITISFQSIKAALVNPVNTLRAE